MRASSLPLCALCQAGAQTGQAVGLGVEGRESAVDRPGARDARVGAPAPLSRILHRQTEPVGDTAQILDAGKYRFRTTTCPEPGTGVTRRLR